MKIASVQWDKDSFPPILKLSIHGAPHRRQSKEVLQKYRDELYAALVASGIPVPINDVLDLYILFVDPSTPDLDNLLTAFYRAADAKALKGKSIMVDDGLVQKVTVAKFYPNLKTKAENRVP